MENDTTGGTAAVSGPEARAAGAGTSPEARFVASPELAAIPWLAHGSSTRAFSTPDADRMDELKRFQAALGLPRLPLVHADQRHTADVGLVDDSMLNRLGREGTYCFPRTDAIVCSHVDVSVVILTADCSPVFVLDLRTRAIGLAHAGWQGTIGRIAERMIRTMIDTGSDPRDLRAWIGPTVGGCCYEVSAELADRFSREFTDAEAEGVKFRAGQADRILDLPALNAFQLRKAGLAADSVSGGSHCTIHQRGTFYSYRADGGSTGRIISMMTSRG